MFAGVIALIVALGKGAAWLFNWKDARDNSRAARLKAWEESLDRREKDQREATEERLDFVEEKLQLVTQALFEALAELQRIDPARPIVARARMALREAYPVDLDVPHWMKVLVGRFDPKN